MDENQVDEYNETLAQADAYSYGKLGRDAYKTSIEERQPKRSGMRIRMTSDYFRPNVLGNIDRALKMEILRMVKRYNDMREAGELGEDVLPISCINF